MACPLKRICENFKPTQPPHMRTRLYLFTADQAEKQIGSDKDLTSGPGETIESTFEFGPGVCLDISQTGAEVRCNLTCSFDSFDSFDCVYSKQRVRTGGKLDQVGFSWIQLARQWQTWPFTPYQQGRGGVKSFGREIDWQCKL